MNAWTRDFHCLRDQENRNIRLIEANTSVWVSWGGFGEQKIFLFFGSILFHFTFLLCYRNVLELDLLLLGSWEKQIGLGKVSFRFQEIKKKHNFQNNISNFSLLSNRALNCFVIDIEFKNLAYAWFQRVLWK